MNTSVQIENPILPSASLSTAATETGSHEPRSHPSSDFAAPPIPAHDDDSFGSLAASPELDTTIAPIATLPPVLEEPLQSSASTVVAFDIEHVAVHDDPRLWSRRAKVTPFSHYQISADVDMSFAPQHIFLVHKSRDCVLLSNSPDPGHKPV